MKKLALTIAIVLGMTFVSFGQSQSYNGEKGLFEKGPAAKMNMRGPGDNSGLLLPDYNQQAHQNADAPVGSGIALLLGMGGAYLIGKRRKE